MKFILAKKFCVYVDFIEKDEKFIPGYVGKGTQKRVICKERNKQHRSYAKKHEWKRVVGFETDDENEAFEIEMLLIRELHTYVYDPEKSEYACNQTLGGDGVTGLRHTKETCEILSKKNILIQKNPEIKLHNRLTHLGIRQSKETCEKKSKIMTGKVKSIEHRKNLSVSHKFLPKIKLVGVKHSMERRSIEKEAANRQSTKDKKRQKRIISTALFKLGKRIMKAIGFTSKNRRTTFKVTTNQVH